MNITTVKEVFSRLKAQYFEIDKVPGDDFEIEIKSKFLILQIFCPEVTATMEESINRLNLKPYEQAVRKFANSDLIFDPLQFSTPGKRLIKGMVNLAAATNNTNDKCPVIVTYIELSE